MAKKLKLSPWHDGSVKPVHVGVYQTESSAISGSYTFQYWNGKFWGFSAFTIFEADREKHIRSCFQEDKWRGVLK